MPNYETKNIFYWITWEVNNLVIKFGQFVWKGKRNISMKKSTESVAWN